MESFHEERQHAFSNLQSDLFNSPPESVLVSFWCDGCGYPPLLPQKSYQNLKFDLGLDVEFDVDVGVGMAHNVDVGVDV